MDPTPTQPQPPDPVGRLGDRELIDLAVETQVAENAARARRLSAITEFHRRQQLAGGERAPGAPSHFILTPLQATTAEFAPVLSVTDLSIEIQLDTATRLQAWFPNLWALCASGRCDIGRAAVLLEAVADFKDEADIARFAALMDAFIAKHDDPTSPILTLTRAQLQRAARHRKAKFAQRSQAETFAAAFTRRGVRLRPEDNGIAHLGANHQVHDLMAADYRLTLIAKKLHELPTETRTLEQIRADVFVDLLLGRLEVTASNATLEHEPDGDDGGSTPTDCTDYLRQHAIGAYARPVINVTVPIQTLIGLTDEPGTLSGGTVIPAELARIIAADPDSTWRRMLTDGTRFLELSTQSYQPTKPIWCTVVARDQTCIWHGCNRPAVLLELDHRIPWPIGRTTDGNLAPLCKRHHKVKHSTGFTLTAHPDGTYTWTTAHGSTITTPPPEQPVTDWPDHITVPTETSDHPKSHEELVLTA